MIPARTEAAPRAASAPRRRAAPAPRWRLRDTVELFPASDGALYVLRGGARGELVIRDPDAPTLALLGALAGDGCTAAEPAVVAAVEQLAELRVVEQVGRRAAGLTDEQARRFDRQLPYFADMAPGGEAAGELQRRLADATVLVLGCGGLGSWALAALACAGVGRFVLVDDDTVELSNLNRQLLFGVDDLGRPKVERAARAVHRLDPAIAVDTHVTRVGSAAGLLALLDGVDVVIETADAPPYVLSRWVQEACARAGVAHVSAGQFPPAVRVGPLFVPGGGACHWCLEQHARERYPLYDELAALRAARPPYAATLGPASGLVGSMLAMEVVHHLTGLCRPATLETALIGDLRTGSWTATPVERHPACPYCG